MISWFCFYFCLIWKFYYIITPMLFYFISKFLHTALWLHTKNNFWVFFSWKILLISLLISESSKTPSWIGTSNRQYLLPKHEMLYSNVSRTRPKISVKTIAHQNVSTLFKNKNLALYTLCPKFFHLYFVMYILYRVMLFTI